MRIIWLSVAALLALAGPAAAQIAAPRLNPIAIEVGVVNPAVLSWDGPSRIGGALGASEADDLPGLPTPDEEGDVRALKFRWVGENFAFGVDAARVERDIDPGVPGVGGGRLDTDSAVLGVAFQYGEVFSVGIGQQTEKSKGPGLFPPGVLVNSNVTITLPVVGATLRLADVIYLGLATGEEDLENDFEVPAILFSDRVAGERTVTRFGVAYHWRDAADGLHLEASREKRGGVPATFFPASVEEADRFNAEIVFSNILIGYESITTEFTSVNGVFEGENEDTTLSVGWAPGQGLAVVASLTEGESFTAGGTLTGEATLTALALAWLF